MAVAMASTARHAKLDTMSTPRATRGKPQPTTGRSLDGDTLLGSPEQATPCQSSPSHTTKRLATTSGRVEKSRPAKSSSIASKLMQLFAAFPSPKRALFASSTRAVNAADNAQPTTSSAAEARDQDSKDTSDPSDPVVDSIEAVDGQQGADAASESWSTDGADEPEFTDWREEQLALNIVLRARHEFTLLPSTWKYNLRGIPIPDTLFYTKTKSKSMRPRIYAIQDRFEYQGETAFRRLIDVHSQIRDLRKVQNEINSDRYLSPSERESRHIEVSAAITSKISRAIERACIWAETDGDLKGLRSQAPPNIMISVLPSSEEHGDILIQENMDNLARQWRKKLGIPDLEREMSEASGSVWGSDDEGDTTIKVEEDDDGRGHLRESPQLGSQPEEVEAGGSSSRQQREKQEQEKQQIKAPVLFGFIIFKHTLMIVTLDANDPAAPCNIPISLNMAESNQHQWNALAIMVTICWARDLLTRVVEEIDIEAAARLPSEDPDA